MTHLGATTASAVRENNEDIVGITTLDAYLATLQRCGYCGQWVSGETCQAEIGVACEGEIEYANAYLAQELHESEMQHEWQMLANEWRANGWM